MALNTFLDFSTTAASNIDVAGIGIQGTNAVSNFDNGFRQLMAILRRDLDNGMVFTSKSAGYTAVANDNNAFIRFSAAATLSLTAAATLGADWHCWVMADGGAVVIDPNSTETINGATTITVPDGTSTLVICDGTNFRALEDYATKLDAIQASVDVASATTTDIGAAASQNVRITGTTTITGLGTVAAGTFRRLRFADALTLTHNGTSLILPGSANIVTVAGDVAEFISEGSGNWRCVSYQMATVAIGGFTHISTTLLSSTASWVQTGLSAFRKLRITGWLLPATDGAILQVRTSTNNGSSYDSGGTDYSWQRLRATGTTVDASADPDDTGVRIGFVGVGNAANEGIQFEVIVDRFNEASHCYVMSRAFAFNSAGTENSVQSDGKRLSTTARNAIQIIFDSGNIASGQITIEGVRS